VLKILFVIRYCYISASVLSWATNWIFLTLSWSIWCAVISCLQQHRLPVFYGLPKVHKDPVSLRPVVSNTNSFLAIFSIWLDHKMKSLLPLIRSYIKNSATIIQELKELKLPEGAKIFSADATSMYTNIDVNLGITTIEDFLQSNEKDLPPQFPSRLFLDILREVMCNNIFTFGETYWLQLQGTAMGTSSACAYATLTYGHHENTSIIPIFHNQLLYYCRYIDDVLGIWIPQEESPGLTWTDFKNKLNNWGVLKWTIEEPSTHTTFLDLNIDINGSSITLLYLPKTAKSVPIPASTISTPSKLSKRLDYWRTQKVLASEYDRKF
jgi:hypothetical protein